MYNGSHVYRVNSMIYRIDSRLEMAFIIVFYLSILLLVLSFVLSLFNLKEETRQLVGCVLRFLCFSLVVEFTSIGLGWLLPIFSLHYFFIIILSLLVLVSFLAISFFDLRKGNTYLIYQLLFFSLFLSFVYFVVFLLCFLFRGPPVLASGRFGQSDSSGDAADSSSTSGIGESGDAAGSSSASDTEESGATSSVEDLNDHFQRISLEYDVPFEISEDEYDEAFKDFLCRLDPM